jgi:hypothetical protein
MFDHLTEHPAILQSDDQCLKNSFVYAGPSWATPTFLCGQEVRPDVQL